MCSLSGNSLSCIFSVWPFDISVLNFDKLKIFLKGALKEYQGYTVVLKIKRTSDFQKIPVTGLSHCAGPVQANLELLGLSNSLDSASHSARRELPCLVTFLLFFVTFSFEISNLQKGYWASKQYQSLQ